MNSYVFSVELEQESDGRWSAVVPALPGCAVDACNEAEALESIREATQQYVEVLVEEGQSVPAEVRDGPIVTVIL
jgi:predicted RNase H-like HicB family nuclease